MPSPPQTRDPAPVVSLPDELPRLSVAGYVAVLDAWAWQQDDESYHIWQLWALSLLGSQQNVKAIWARLLKGEMGSVQFESLGYGRSCTLAPLGASNWKLYSAPLPAAAAHQIVLVPKLSLYTHESGDFLLLARSEEEAPLLHYRFLNRRLSIPLHPSWADWLWERAKQVGEAVRLTGESWLACHCTPKPSALLEEISVAVRQGRLGVPSLTPTKEVPKGKAQEPSAKQTKPRTRSKPLAEAHPTGRAGRGQRSPTGRPATEALVAEPPHPPALGG